MKRVTAWEVLALALVGMPIFGCGVDSSFREAINQPSLPIARGAQENPPESLPNPQRLNEPPPVSPLLALLSELEENSAEGLSLDAAIDRLLSANLDLAARFQDIPKARADVLTAGLRNDPVVFMSAVPIPYGQFSAQRPGATAYDITFVQPLDLSGKHKTNKRVAEKSISVLEARYQDVVRLEIDRLFTIYVTMLETRAVLRAAQATLKQLTDAAERCDEQVRQGRRTQSDCTRVSIRRARARIAVRQAEASLANARRNLSVLLAIPAGEADHLRLCGSLRTPAPPPPPLSELIEIARGSRPDLLALHLSVDRAHAELRREKAEALDDFFLFFTPYQALDQSPQGKLTANSWEIGVLVPIPSLNRNQGEIAHARVNVSQWRMEVERAEQQIIEEVRHTEAEYTLSFQTVEQYERDILAHGRRRRDEAYHRFLVEDKALGSYLAAQRDYDEMIRAYVEALGRHRRAVLRLNTAVGKRILP